MVAMLLFSKGAAGGGVGGVPVPSSFRWSWPCSDVLCDGRVCGSCFESVILEKSALGVNPTADDQILSS